MKLTVRRQIENYIDHLNEGSVITVSDFSTLTNAKTASKNLERLCNEKKIEKVMRGIFWKPDHISSSPNEDLVAQAIAKANRWQLIPCGDTALHTLGLRKEKPKRWTYITDGTYRSYSYDGKFISFQHTRKNWFSSLSKKTALLYQAIKAYGKDKITDDVKLSLYKKFNTIEKSTLKNETKIMPTWVSKMINSIFIKNKKETAKETN